MKTKRINLIVKGKGIVASLLGIREKKVTRAVESAADYVEESILELETAKLKAIEALGKGADSTPACKDAIQNYCNSCEKIEAWNRQAGYIKQLKADLQEEVEESEEENA